MSSTEQGRRLFIVAGEASADLHAASLLRELKSKTADLRFFGVGGRHLSAEGMEILVEANSLNVVGGSDWLGKAGEVFRSYRSLVKALKKSPPSVALLLDLPDFNLRIAKVLKRLNVPVIYYISPQVWAWRKYRIHTIQKYIDRMLVVFPFEKDFYAQHNVSVEFVGHPLLESIRQKEHYRTSADRLASPRLALLPGSRLSELKYHAPILRDLIPRIYERYPSAEIRIPVASTLPLADVKRVLGGLGPALELDNSREILAWADAAVVASGTATLETALIGTPFCLFYRLSHSSAFFFQRIARYRGFLGMPNLLHQKEVVREFFQQRATAENLFTECRRLLEDDTNIQSMISRLGECRTKLGSNGASARAASHVWSVLELEGGSEALNDPKPLA